MVNYNNIQPNQNKCKLINIVWIERGILLTIMSYILKKYNMLLTKIIIVENDRCRDFLKILFPTHNFQKFVAHNLNNFYFNVRKIIYYQDIIIDYVANCEDTLHAKKINLVPWYDMNDMLIYYKIDNSKKLSLSMLMPKLKFFSKCTRGNFYGYTWDAYVEANIIQKYMKINKKINANVLLQLINNFLLKEYTAIPTTIQNITEYPQIYYSVDNSNAKNEIKKIQVENDQNLNELINLITNKLAILNDI